MNYLDIVPGQSFRFLAWDLISHFNISQFQLAPEMYIGCPAAAGAGAAPVGDGADAGPAPWGHLDAFTVLFLLLPMSLRF